MTTAVVILTTWTIICTIVAAFIARKPLTTVIRVSLHGEEFAGYDFTLRKCRDDYVVLARLGEEALQLKLTEEGVEIGRDDSKMTDIAETTKDRNWVRR